MKHVITFFTQACAIAFALSFWLGQEWLAGRTGLHPLAAGLIMACLIGLPHAVVNSIEFAPLNRRIRGNRVRYETHRQRR